MQVAQHANMQDLMSLSATLRERLLQEAAGEDILWIGQPDPDRLFRSSLIVLPLGLAFIAASLVLNAHAIGKLLGTAMAAPASSLPSWFAIPFGLLAFGFGLLLLVLPGHARRAADATVFALTRRAVIDIHLHRWRFAGPEVERYDVTRILRTAVKARKHGRGDVWIEFNSRRLRDQEDLDFILLRDINGAEALKAAIDGLLGRTK